MLIQQEVARRQSSPDTGKFSARPAGKPGSEFVKESLRRSLRCHWLPAPINTAAPPYAFSEAWRNLSVRCGSKPKTKPWVETILPPAGRPRAQGKGRAGRITPFSLSAMSSGRLILDRVGRHQSPSLLPRQEQNNTRSREYQGKGDISILRRERHFYFALTQAILQLDSTQAPAII